VVLRVELEKANCPTTTVGDETCVEQHHVFLEKMTKIFRKVFKRLNSF
jgi:hypothetical protein